MKFENARLLEREFKLTYDFKAPWKPGNSCIVYRASAITCVSAQINKQLTLIHSRSGLSLSDIHFKI